MNLSIIEHQNQRVLTTSQLAESFGTDNKVISKNFTRNVSRYTEGKHFFNLTGEDLKEFIANRQIDDLPRNVNRIYLWTEKGAWLHAKSLNTDEAWNAYEMLVDEYYNIKEQSQQLPSLELALRAALEHEQEIKTIKTDVNYLKGSMRIDFLQQKDMQKAARTSVVRALGGKDTPAYEELSKKVFPALWNEFKDHFGVPRYPDLPKIKFEEAMRFIDLWRPSTSLQIEIDNSNSQMVLG